MRNKGKRNTLSAKIRNSRNDDARSVLAFYGKEPPPGYEGDIEDVVIWAWKLGAVLRSGKGDDLPHEATESQGKKVLEALMKMDDGFFDRLADGIRFWKECGEGKNWVQPIYSMLYLKHSQVGPITIESLKARFGNQNERHLRRLAKEIGLVITPSKRGARRKKSDS